MSDPIRLVTHLTPADYVRFSGLTVKRLRAVSKRRRWVILAVWLVIWLLLCGALVALGPAGKAIFSGREINLLLLGMVTGLLFTVFFTITINHALVSKMVGGHDTMIGRFDIEASEADGLVSTGTRMTTRLAWSAITDVWCEHDLVILWLDRGVGMVIAGNAFADEAERDRFVSFVRCQIEAARAVA